MESENPRLEEWQHGNLDTKAMAIHISEMQTSKSRMGARTKYQSDQSYRRWKVYQESFLVAFFVQFSLNGRHDTTKTAKSSYFINRVLFCAFLFKAGTFVDEKGTLYEGEWRYGKKLSVFLFKRHFSRSESDLMDW